MKAIVTAQTVNQTASCVVWPPKATLATDYSDEFFMCVYARCNLANLHDDVK